MRFPWVSLVCPARYSIPRSNVTDARVGGWQGEFILKCFSIP